MDNSPPDIKDILRRAARLMDFISENSEQISAIAHDSNDELTALATSLWFIRQSELGVEGFAEGIKVHMMAAFYLGYRVGQEEGDLTIWENM